MTDDGDIKNMCGNIGKFTLLFFIMANNKVLFELLPKQWKNTIENDRIMQHVICVITIMALIIMFLEYSTSVFDIFAYTGIIYILFLLMSKLDLQWSIAIIAILLSTQLYNFHIDIKTREINNTQTLTNIQKKYEIEKISGDYKLYFGSGYLFFLCAGFLLYADKKEGQYGGGFSPLQFILY